MHKRGHKASSTCLWMPVVGSKKVPVFVFLAKEANIIICIYSIYTLINMHVVGSESCFKITEWPADFGRESGTVI